MNSISNYCKIDAVVRFLNENRLLVAGCVLVAIGGIAKIIFDQCRSNYREGWERIGQLQLTSKKIKVFVEERKGQIEGGRMYEIVYYKNTEGFTLGTLYLFDVKFKEGELYCSRYGINPMKENLFMAQYVNDKKVSKIWIEDMYVNSTMPDVSEKKIYSALIQIAIEKSIKSGYEGRLSAKSQLDPVLKNGEVDKCSPIFLLGKGFLPKQKETTKNETITISEKGEIMHMTPESKEKYWKEKIHKRPILFN